MGGGGWEAGRRPGIHRPCEGQQLAEGQGEVATRGHTPPDETTTRHSKQKGAAVPAASEVVFM